MYVLNDCWGSKVGNARVFVAGRQMIMLKEIGGDWARGDGYVVRRIMCYWGMDS